MDATSRYAVTLLLLAAALTTGAHATGRQMLACSPSQLNLTTLNMDELPFQGVNKITIEGVGFNYTVNGVSNDDCYYSSSAGPKVDAVIEGGASGDLRILFVKPESYFKMAVYVSRIDEITISVTYTHQGRVLDTDQVKLVRGGLPDSNGFTSGWVERACAAGAFTEVLLSVVAGRWDRFAIDMMSFNTIEGEGLLRKDPRMISAQKPAAGQGWADLNKP